MRSSTRRERDMRSHILRRTPPRAPLREIPTRSGWSGTIALRMLPAPRPRASRRSSCVRRAVRRLPERPSRSHVRWEPDVEELMEVMQAEIPPFERFYVEHRDEVLGYLRRLLGQRAEDAWQETFLRALRAYDRLQHARNLRSWVFTIATNVAMDELRAS